MGPPVVPPHRSRPGRRARTGNGTAATSFMIVAHLCSQGSSREFSPVTLPTEQDRQFGLGGVQSARVPLDLMIMGKMWLSGQPYQSHDHGIEQYGSGLRRNARRSAALAGRAQAARAGWFGGSAQAAVPPGMRWRLRATQR
ncbi:hypothetical protein GCM10010199_65150 [Dactylosporangium roseum]